MAGRLAFRKEHGLAPEHPVCKMTMGSCAWQAKPRPPLTEDSAVAWALYGAAQTQWRVGMSGATGLDYGAVQNVARWLDLNLTGRVFRLLRALEAKRLLVWAADREHREKASKR